MDKRRKKKEVNKGKILKENMKLIRKMEGILLMKKIRKYRRNDKKKEER